MRSIKVGTGYRQRHSNCTIATCFIMLILVVGSGYYIWNYAITNKGIEEEPDDYEVSIVMYAPTTNLTGTIRVLFSNGTLFQMLSVDTNGIVSDINRNPQGVYKLYYEGDSNDIVFGPVEYTVLAANTLLVDKDYVGVRLTIRTL